MMLIDQTTRNQLVCENLRTIIYIKILSVNFVNPMDLVIGSLLYKEWKPKEKEFASFCMYLPFDSFNRYSRYNTTRQSLNANQETRCIF